MDNMTMKETAALSIQGMHCEKCIQRIRAALDGLEGVEDLDVSLGSVKLGYYPMAVSMDHIIERISSLGYSVPLTRPSRNPFHRFLDGMIRANEEAFGSEPPSCCGGKKA